MYQTAISQFPLILLFGVLGLGLEVIFTAIWEIRKDNRIHLLGVSSIWYVPLYGLTPIIFRCIGPTVFAYPVFVRGIIYSCIFYAFEYSGMLALRLLLGTSPSEENYYRSGRSLHGLIRWDFAPGIFLLGLIMECVFQHIQLI